MAQVSNGKSPKRKSIRHWIIVTILAWGISFIIIASFGIYVIIKGQQINTELCRVSDSNRTLLVNILSVSRDQELSNANSRFERNLIRQRFNTLRALIPPLKCSVQGGPVELEP